MKISKMNELLTRELPKVKGIVVKSTDQKFYKGDNPFYDMQIENYIVCPVNNGDWYGFNKNDYELIMSN